jgi:hypothetical protein
MTKTLVLWFRVVLLTLCLTVAVSASTWRSTSGNVFTFYPDGSMTANVGGGQYNGEWWWVSSNWKFGFRVYGFGDTYVTMEGNGAIAQTAGKPAQYWTLISSRGSTGESEPEDNRSWLMPQLAPAGRK